MTCRTLGGTSGIIEAKIFFPVFKPQNTSHCPWSWCFWMAYKEFDGLPFVLLAPVIVFTFLSFSWYLLGSGILYWLLFFPLHKMLSCLFSISKGLPSDLTLKEAAAS